MLLVSFNPNSHSEKLSPIEICIKRGESANDSSNLKPVTSIKVFFLGTEVCLVSTQRPKQ